MKVEVLNRRTILPSLILILFTGLICLGQNSYKSVEFESTDGLLISGELYPAEAPNATLILLFHQAGYSRGAYREIAPKLQQLGYHCLAIDQRSGKGVKGIDNETFKRAEKAEKPTKYLDALPDLEAAYQYGRQNFKSSKIILWGSSYSASLSIYLASQLGNDIKGLIAFAPGEYFEINGLKLAQYAKDIQCKVFITSAKSEHENWENIYQQVNTDKSYFLPKGEGKHGSKALWAESPEHEAYWSALENFLKTL